MYYHRLLISYKGTNYFGWQDLGASQEKLSVEASLHKVLKKICKDQPYSMSAASRTDAGVHAQGQVIKITMSLLLDSEKLLLGMNSLLPDDIRVLKSESCASEFNVNKNSTSKEYHYYFCTDTIHNPVLNDIMAHIPSNAKAGVLDIESMQKGCKLFVGEHDFYSFAKRDRNMHSTFRTVLSCEIVQVQPSMFGNNVYYIKIVGKGFLRYMVRYIAGALFALGRKQISQSDISEALLEHKEEKLSSRAKSRGLHLIQVSY